MHAFLISCGAVFLAEMGDKTQLLAFILAAKFRKPWVIIFGILCATVLNHLLASWFGVWLADKINPSYLQWILGASFLLMAIWVLIPDKENTKESAFAKWGVFATACLTFFLAEMGDKTQLATIALAAQYQSVWLVATGTVLGMLLADVPAVFLGGYLAQKTTFFVWLRYVTSAIFLALALLAFIR